MIFFLGRFIMRNSIDADAEIIRNAGVDVKDDIFRFCKYTEIRKTLYACGLFAACGFSAHLIFLVIFIAVFTNNNIYRAVVINSRRLISKDAAYDFLRQHSANWRLFIINTANKITIFCHRLTSKKHKKAAIFDDTTFKNNSSGKVEL